METNIINALKRLERLGQENSRVTEKARKATNEIEKKLAEILPRNVPLPGNYEVVYYGGYEDWILAYGVTENPYGGDDEIRKNNNTYWATKIHNAPRGVILKFSADIANGLLDRFADFMEARKAEIEEKAKILEDAEKSI